MFIKIGLYGININQIRYWKEVPAGDHGPLKVLVDMGCLGGIYNVIFEGQEAAQFLQAVERLDPEYIPY